MHTRPARLVDNGANVCGDVDRSAVLAQTAHRPAHVGEEPLRDFVRALDRLFRLPVAEVTRRLELEMHRDAIGPEKSVQLPAQANAPPLPSPPPHPPPRPPHP